MTPFEKAAKEKIDGAFKKWAKGVSMTSEDLALLSKDLDTGLPLYPVGVKAELFCLEYGLKVKVPALSRQVSTDRQKAVANAIRRGEMIHK